MLRCAHSALRLMVILLSLLLTACSSASGVSLFESPMTVYTLVERPRDYAGQQVTVQGFYLWKPGDPGIAVLLPGVSTADGVRDAQPIYASVECQADGTCRRSTERVGEPSTGAVWLDNFPAEVTADLHRPGDSVWGVVEVTGQFEANGGYGPDGSYRYRIDVREARALQKVERIVSAVQDEPLGEGKVSIFELARQPERYQGQRVVTRGYYFWSPATQGSLVERVEREKVPDTPDGIAPLPAGIRLGLEGFPPELSAQLHVDPNGQYVWGLVEVEGTFQIGSFADGRYDKQIVAERVTVVPEQE